MNKNTGENLILDVCCGSRIFWHQKNHPSAIYCDRRIGDYPLDVGTPGTIGRSPVVVRPDIQSDFMELPFQSSVFSLVVFDPPHSIRAGEKSWLWKKYGKLIGDWPEVLREGFAECFRVLRDGGTLIFKWSNIEIPTKDVLLMAGRDPLFGHPTKNGNTTHWFCFQK